MKVYGLGLRGERAARRFLRLRGYRILERNYQCRFGELDLIAKKNGWIVFCEVKARSAGMLDAPQAFVTPVKQQKMLKTARYYLMKKNLSDVPARFDVLAVTFNEKGACTVEHLENVMEC